MISIVRPLKWTPCIRLCKGRLKTIFMHYMSSCDINKKFINKIFTLRILHINNASYALMNNRKQNTYTKNKKYYKYPLIKILKRLLHNAPMSTLLIMNFSFASTCRFAGFQSFKPFGSVRIA